MDNNKNEIRQHALKKRDAIPAEVRKAKSAMIAEQTKSLSEFKDARTLSIYASFRSEVETIEMIKSLLGSKHVALPKVDNELKKLKLYEVKNIGELALGAIGILEPDVTEDRLIEAGDIDLFIVPGAAFDINGYRIGYGGGYYDKLLSKAKKDCSFIALGFEEQIIANIPFEIHDIKMHKIVTDNRFINCAKS
ncbi:MAG: 5-formyltetrahydrofolate cyclo-ligase [Nitrospiraceae bacterium]|nr:5-formyltetrahydrofolate cyclo-ligase [Nitrospiraceae bacterium]